MITVFVKAGTTLWDFRTGQVREYWEAQWHPIPEQARDGHRVSMHDVPGLPRWRLIRMMATP